MKYYKNPFILILRSKVNSRLCSLSSRLHKSLYIIIYYHTRSLSSLLSKLWIQVSTQSSLMKSLSGSQSSPALLSGHDNPALSSRYLGLKDSPTLLSSQLFQNCSRHIHTSGSIVSGNSQKPVLSSLALLVFDLCHLINTPWSILITRLTTTQRRKASCVQPTGCSLSQCDIWGWSSLMLWLVDDLQIPKRNILPACT